MFPERCCWVENLSIAMRGVGIQVFMELVEDYWDKTEEEGLLKVFIIDNGSGFAANGIGWEKSGI